MIILVIIHTASPEERTSHLIVLVSCPYGSVSAGNFGHVTSLIIVVVMFVVVLVVIVVVMVM